MTHPTDLERLLYIEALLLANGSVSRAELCQRFGFSVRSATRILKLYMAQCPDRMAMRFAGDAQDKPAYVRCRSAEPCYFTDRQQAQAYLEVSNQLKDILDQVAGD